MTLDPDETHIEATRGLLFGALGGLFLWSVALGYTCHRLMEAMQCP